MKQIVGSVLGLALCAMPALGSGSSDSRYLVMSLSLGEVDAEQFNNVLLFMSLYFDLEEDGQLSFPPNIDPVYAEVSTIIVPGHAFGDVAPGDPLYGSRMMTERYRRGDPDFDALLIDYNPIAPWYELQVDTPRLDTFRMVVSTTVSPFDGADGEVLSRDPLVYRSPIGHYDISGRVVTLNHGTAGLYFNIRSGEMMPELFVYNIGFVDTAPFEVCGADINRDGEINFYDVTAFIESYQDGCP